MRVAACPGCGKQLKGATDDELVEQGIQHAKEAHADQNLSDEQIRALVAQGAKDE